MGAFLITGGAGFIGSHLADALVARGDRVVILDDLSTGRLENVQHLIDDDRVELVEGCVTDPLLVRDLMRDVDSCCHLASAVGVQLVVDRPLESLQRNVNGMQTVIPAAADLGVRLMVASTSEIYGKSTNGSLAECDDRILGAPTTARWGYANAKVFGEMLAYGFHREHGAANTVTRFFNTVGPRQSGAYGMVVPRFVEQALAGEPLTIYGDGTQARCFTHVADSVDAIVRLFDDDRSIGNVYNVGRPKAVTIQDLAHRVLALTESDSEIVYVPYDEAYGDGFEELGRRCPDTTAIEMLTGWRSRFDIDRAINDIIAHDRSVDDVIAHDRSMNGAVIA